MTEPWRIDVQADEVELRALSWGPPNAPIALCLHDFADTAYGWRRFAPRLAGVGVGGSSLRSCAGTHRPRFRATAVPPAGAFRPLGRVDERGLLIRRFARTAGRQ